jgi:hypothetical protein
MSSFFRKASLLCLLIVACLLSATAASALTVSPVLFDQTVNPGSSSHGSIQLLNDTNQDQTFYASVQNFVPQGEEGRQQFLPETDTSGLVSWISLEKPSIVLKAGQTVAFNWVLNIPKDAEPGGHYAAVFFSTLPQGKQGSVGIGAKTGVLFLVNVNGKIKEDADVESFLVMNHDNSVSEQQLVVSDRLPVNFELRVRNNGSVHIQPQGTVRVTDMFGREVASIPTNPLNSRVLPSSVRRIRSSWGPSDLPNNAGFFSDVMSEVKGFGFGRYTATVAVAYGTQAHQPLTATVSFWIIPWRLLLVVCILLLVFVLFLKWYNRQVVKSAMKKATKKELL